MNNTQEQKSLLSAIPKDISNIIKNFSLETRVVCPLKINTSYHNYYITKYKEGYKIDKVLSINKFEREEKRSSEQEKERLLNLTKKDIKKHYPMFIDRQDDVIQYFYTLFYYDYDPDDHDDDDDPDDFEDVVISVSSANTHCYVENFKRKLGSYMKLIGKLYKKV